VKIKPLEIRSSPAFEHFAPGVTEAWDVGIKPVIRVITK
jgi:hypothetical protein